MKICVTIGYRLTENRPDLEGGSTVYLNNRNTTALVCIGLTDFQLWNNIEILENSDHTQPHNSFFSKLVVPAIIFKEVDVWYMSIWN